MFAGVIVVVEHASIVSVILFITAWVADILHCSGIEVAYVRAFPAWFDEPETPATVANGEVGI
jgi:hypothetical protein